MRWEQDKWRSDEQQADKRKHNDNPKHATGFQVDWPRFGSVRVRGSWARTWTCTLRFGSSRWWTRTWTKCSCSLCSVHVRTMFVVKKVILFTRFNVQKKVAATASACHFKGSKWGFPKKKIKGWCLSPTKLLLHPFSVYPHFVQNKYCTHTMY